MRRLATLLAGVWLAGSSVAQSPPPGVWHGTSFTERSSNLGYATLVLRYESEFTLTGDAAGRIQGTATVRYSMSLDDGKLRGLIGRMNAMGNHALGMIPGIGGLIGLGAQTVDLQGMSAGYDEGTAVRLGAVTGYVRDGQMHLAWAEPPDPIPYKTQRIYPLKRETVKAATGPAYAPWSADAELREVMSGRWEAQVPAARSSGTKGKMSWTSYWSAHQG